VLFFAFLSALSVSAETKVLVVGDSHTVGDFGDALVSKLKTQPDFRVALSASCGSSPTHWLGTPYRNAICSSELDYNERSPKKNLQPGSHPMPSFQALVQEKKPDTVVIALGGNQMPKDPKASLTGARKDVARMIQAAKVNGAKCIWISPPARVDSIYPREIQDRFTAMLVEVTREQGCAFVNSRNHTNAKDTVNDPFRVHYYRYPGKNGRNPGGEWGSGVGAEVITSIRVNGPTGSQSSTPSSAASGN